MRNLICYIFAAVIAVQLFPVSAFAEDQSSAAEDEIVTFIVETEFSPAAEYTAQKKLGISFYSGIDEDEIADNLLSANSEILEAAAHELNADPSQSFVYTQLFSGFTITVRRGDIDKLLGIDGVVNAYEDALAYAIDDKASVSDDIDEIETSTVYNGKGTAIAIIDSGFELSHDYFKENPLTPKYTEDDINSIIANSLSNRGKYYSPKIPFTYDYYEKSSDDASIGNNSEHGTHVSGIAAGKNGIVSNEYTINGAAPEAQLILMACADQSGSMPLSTIMSALNDAAALDVDVINMSLGIDYVDIRSSAYTAVLNAVSNAHSAGIPVCVSSGNASRGFYNEDPSVLNPDYCAEGLFGKFSDAFSVASAQSPNYYIALSKLILSSGDSISCLNVSSDNIQDFTSIFNSPTEYVDCGLGQAEDFSGKNLSGKIALIKRGEINFSEKTENAKAAGASGVIIINTDDEYISISGCTLPTAIVTQSDGQILLNCNTKTIYVSDSIISLVESSDGDKPSSFTSWGFTEKLELTPNITAYGGNVYSAAPGNSYQNMSGTSMSSPYIAGTCACVKEYLNTNPFGSLAGINEAELIQQLLMTTAVPIRDTDESGAALSLPYSPRQQGAGHVDLDNALKTPVVLYNSSGKTVLNLGDNINDSFTLSFTAKNYSNTPVTFSNITVDALTDNAAYVQDDPDYIFSYGTTELPVEALSFDPVTINANSTETITLSVTLDAEKLTKIAAVYKNGFYIDGFVRLTNDDYSIGIPFSGFHGSWGDIPLWDSTIYDDGGSTLIYTDAGINGTYISTTIDNKSVKLTDKNHLIFSPNNDGKYDSISVSAALYRSSNNIKFEIIKDGQTYKTVQKNGVYSKYTPYTLSMNTSLNDIPDGSYILRMTGYADNGSGGYTAQTLDLPIIIDKTAPDVDMTLSNDWNTLTVKAEDANYIKSIELNYKNTHGDTITDTVSLDNDPTIFEHNFTLQDANPFTITVTALDYAYNTSINRDLAVTYKENESASTAFKLTAANSSDETISYSNIRGTVTSNGKTNSFSSSMTPCITLAENSECIIGIIIEDLYDNEASISMTLY